MTTQLSGQFDLVSAQEDTALPSTTDVASFTDSNHADTTTAFTATIVWGDGQTTTGTVVGSNGTFTVEGGHTYADEGVYNGATVTVVRTADNSQLVLSSAGIDVSDTDNLTGHSAPTITASPNQALTNVTVATFTDTNNVNVPSDFTVNIDWGDGQTTTGILNGSNGVFTVTGSHTYAAAGDYTITTFMDDDSADSAFGIATTQAAIGFGGVLTPPAGTSEFVAIPSGTQIATFVDNSGDPASDYTASIDWGDGQTTTGNVSGTNGLFTVTGGPHTYSDEGDYTEVVTVTNTADNATTTISGTETVAENDNLTATAAAITSSQTLTNVTVATFTDTTITVPTGPASNVASDFDATINWGDGASSTGTISGSGGSFTVTGSHTYARSGKDTITVDIAEDPSNGQGFANATTSSTLIIGVVPGTGSDFNTSEGTAIAAGLQIATFFDGNTSDTAGAFAATIDWGDGTSPTSGTVSGSNGSFTITGPAHIYADEGQDTITTTVTGPGNTQITIAGSATVADADQFTITGDTFNGIPGQSLNNIQVATFTDTYTDQVVSDLTATIDWGDGTSLSLSAGTISQPGGPGTPFTVNGSHTYATTGHYSVDVTVSDDAPDSAVGSESTLAAIIGLVPGTGSSLTTPEDTAIATGTQVATFLDGNTSDTAADFTQVSIDWGDGTVTSGTVSGTNGSFTVTGGPHTYADEGSDTITTTVTKADNEQATIIGSATVTDADNFSVTADSLSGNAGQLFNSVQVATFSDAYINQIASDLAATINWGDGTFSPGTISGGSGSFTVDGSHTYTTGANYTTTVTVLDDAPGTAIASGSATATINLAGQVVLTTATEGTALANSTPVATFSDSNLSDTAGSFTAAINWGDGTTMTETVVGSNGSFTVEGGHTYADEGNDQASVTLTRTDGASSTVSGTVTVADADAFTPQGLTVGSFAVLASAAATFTDTYTGQVASALTATITWGDGAATTGTVTGSNGSFTVNGTHAYATGGIYTTAVTLADDAPGVANATVSANVTINLGGSMVLASATEGTALPSSTQVATFSDSTPGDTAASFTAAINWGDGVTTIGTVTGSNGLFTVDGGHTYADEGNDQASVTLTRTADNAQSTATGTVVVHEGDVLTGQSLKITPTAGQTSITAAFSDVDTVTAADDFTAAINWGDGTITAGIVSSSKGSLTVDGSHTYALPPPLTVTVTLADDAPGTAVASVSGAVPPISMTHQVNVLEGGSVSAASLGDGNVTVTAINGGTVGSPDMGSFGTLTLNANDSYSYTANNAAAIKAAPAGSHPTDTFTYTVTGQGASTTDTLQFSIDRPPTQTTHSVSVNESASTGTLAAGDTDPDGDGITVTGVTGGTLAAPLAGAYGTLTLNANDTFSYTANNFAAIDAAPANPTDTFTYTVGDGHGGSTTETLDLTINRLPEAPNSNLEEWVLANGQFAAGAAPGSIPGDFKVAAIGDFTGTGTDDILWQSPSSGDVAEWIMSDAAWNGTVDFGKAPAGLQIEGSGHFFGSDAPSDVLWFNPNTGETDLWEMSNGNWAGTVKLGTIPGTGWQVAAVGDFTGNGTDDIIWHNTTTGDVAEWLIQNGDWAGSVDFGTEPAGLQLEGTGHFFGSNAPEDVLWLNPNTGETDLWEMSNGNWAATVNVGTIPGTGWQVAGIGDFTGNGTDDILWHNTQTGDFAEWLIQNGHWAGSVDFGNVPGWNVAGIGHFISGNNTSNILWHANT